MSTLKANRIENLTTTNGGIDINNSGNVGVGASSPGANLEVRGSSSNGQIRIGGSTSGTYSQIYSDNDGVLILNADQGNNAASSYLGLNVDNSERLRIDSSGRVGIGTSAPDTKVHVVGSLKVENTSGTGNAWTYYKNPDRTYLVGVRGSGSDALSFYDLTADAERMRIDTSGRVGIGTSSPSFELQVTQSGSASEIAATSNVTSGTASRLLLGNSVGTARATFNLTGGGSELAYLGTEGNFPMYFQTNGAERMRITSNGRLLLGSTSSIGGDAIFQVQTTGNRKAHFHQPDSGGSIIQFTNTTTGTGTSDGFEIALNGSEDGQIWLYESSNIKFGTANTERMKIANDGSFRVLGVYNFTLASSANVHVDSGGLIRRVTSSAKYKTNIETIEDSYADALLNCRPVWYQSTCEGDNPDYSWWGFIAEEVAEIDPRLVHWKTTNVTYDENGQAVETPCDPEAEGVLYDRFVPHLVNLVKRQQEAIKTLETKVAALEAAE